MKIFFAFAILAVAVQGDDCIDKSAEYMTCVAKLAGETDVCSAANGVLDCAKKFDCPSWTRDAEENVKDLGCNGCFPATATVELSNGKTKFMDQVKIGDKVRVGPNEFSEVYFFSTQLSEVNAKFTKIVADGADIVLTASHYLYVNGGLSPAGSVQVGDVIVLANGTKASVAEVSGFWAPGLYNAHTLHGDIIVNGVKASTYTTAVHPTLAHALLSPLRTMYAAGVTFGEGFSTAVKGLPSWLLNAIKA